MKIKAYRLKLHNSVNVLGTEYSFINNYGEKAPHTHISVEIDGEWVKISGSKSGLTDVTYTRANNVISCKEIDESEAAKSSKAPVKNSNGRNKPAEAEQA